MGHGFAPKVVKAAAAAAAAGTAIAAILSALPWLSCAVAPGLLEPSFHWYLLNLGSGAAHGEAMGLSSPNT